MSSLACGRRTHGIAKAAFAFPTNAEACAFNEQGKGMTEEEKNAIREIILAETTRLKQDIEGLKEVTRPVVPEDMDDITRMDAIVNRSVNDAALAAAKSRLAKLEYAGKRLDDPEFGYCVECGEAIPVKRLLAMPESTLCVDCAE